MLNMWKKNTTKLLIQFPAYNHVAPNVTEAPKGQSHPTLAFAWQENKAHHDSTPPRF